MIRDVLIALAVVILTIILAWVYLMRRLQQAMGGVEAQSILDGLDAGLNIPMRDGETRPKARPHPLASCAFADF